MEIIPKTMLKVDPKKDAFEAGKVCEVTKKIGEDLVKRGLATLPVIEPAAEEVNPEDGDIPPES